jgi:hypothetical protein
MQLFFYAGCALNFPYPQHLPNSIQVRLNITQSSMNHADLGQMQLYVNYYDREIAAADDNPRLA